MSDQQKKSPAEASEDSRDSLAELIERPSGLWTNTRAQLSGEDHGVHRAPDETASINGQTVSRPATSE